MISPKLQNYNNYIINNFKKITKYNKLYNLFFSNLNYFTKYDYKKI